MRVGLRVFSFLFLIGVKKMSTNVFMHDDSPEFFDSIVGFLLFIISIGYILNSSSFLEGFGLFISAFGIGMIFYKNFPKKQVSK